MTREINMIAVGTLAVALTMSAHADSIWTGAKSAAWTDPGNWLENRVPGSGERALFDRETSHATIDLDGMSAVAEIAVSGEAAPSLVFGTSTGQKLVLDQGGRVSVGATVVRRQTVKATLCYDCAEQVAAAVHVSNDSPEPLVIYAYDGPVTGVTGWLGPWEIYFHGSGDVVKMGRDSVSGGGTHLRLCQDEGAKLEFAASGTFYLISTSGKGDRQHVQVNAGCILTTSNAAQVFNLRADGDELWLSGEGELNLSSSDVNAGCYLGWPGVSGAVTIDCSIRRIPGGMVTLGFWNATRYSFSGDNEITGTIRFHEGGTARDLAVPSFGTAEAAGPTGKGCAIEWGLKGCRLVYVGPGDTLTQPLVLTKDGCLANEGSGTFRVESAISGTGGLSLQGGAFAIATDVPNALLPKPGVVTAFSLRPGETSARRSVGKLTLPAGRSTVVVEDGVTVDVGACSADGAVLNVVLSKGRIRLAGLSAGEAPDWITVNGAKAFVGPSGEVGTMDLRVADQSIDARGGVVANGPGALVSVDSADGPEGEVISLSSASAEIGALRQAQPSEKAVLELKDGQSLTVGTLFVSEGAAPLCVRAAEGASASLSSTTVQNGEVELGGSLTAGNVAVGALGRLVVNGGAVRAARIMGFPDGDDLDQVKSYVQNGGSVRSEGEAVRVGSVNGHGLFELNGGLYESCGTVGYGGNGLMAFVQHGGLYSQTNGSFGLYAKNGGFAHFCQRAGTFLSSGPGKDVFLAGGQDGGSAAWTIDGAEAVTRIRSATDSRNFVVGGMYGSSTTGKDVQNMLNVNSGGTIHCGLIVTAKGHAASGKAYLNFNGGVYCNDYLYGQAFADAANPWYDRLDRITLFANGMTVQTSTDCATSVPLDAPPGKGVSRIAWPGLPTAFASAPLVRIAGDGQGASAYAAYDSATRTVSGIVVSSPGWNYTEAVAEVLYGTRNGRPTVIAAIPCELADNVSGGLTKTGSGSFTLACASTYTGPTTVRQGTLALGCDNAVNPASELVLDGGTLNLRGHAQAFAGLDCRRGSVVDGDSPAKVTLTGLKVDFEAALSGTVKTVDMDCATFADGAEIALANFDATRLEGLRRVKLAVFRNGKADRELRLADGVALPGDWWLRASGVTVALVRRQGLVLVVR